MTELDPRTSLDPQWHVEKFSDVDHQCLFTECPGYRPRADRPGYGIRSRAVDISPAIDLAAWAEPNPHQPAAQPSATCGHTAQGADDKPWPCIRAPHDSGHHWYGDHRAE